MKIVLTGGTGFIGSALVEGLVRKGHEVILLTRRGRLGNVPLGRSVTVETWDGKNPGAWEKCVDGADALINLAGEPIFGKRWSPDQKKKILESRVDATAALVQAVKKAAQKPSCLINASAVGYYGDVPEGDLTESASRGSDFLAETCVKWEEAARQAEPLGIRVVMIRIGIVLEEGGGALAKMIPPFKMFMGGPVGSGRQWFSWIHRDDVIGIFLFALDQPTLSGPVNATASEPVRMKGFCQALGKAMNRPSWLSVPAFVLKLTMGEVAGVLLGGQKVIPQKALAAGYSFHYSKLEEALKAIFLT